MTLEKLLLFGFGLAVLTTVVFGASGMHQSRETQDTGYRAEVNKVKDKAN